jgi:hypothetical protein
MWWRHSIGQQRAMAHRISRHQPFSIENPRFSPLELLRMDLAGAWTFDRAVWISAPV